MVKLTDIHPLTSFLRDHRRYVSRLRETGRPEVLTVNGEACLVLQDAAAYQLLLERVEALETERLLRDRLESVRRGDPGVEASEVLAEVRRTLGLEG